MERKDGRDRRRDGEGVVEIGIILWITVVGGKKDMICRGLGLNRY